MNLRRIPIIDWGFGLSKIFGNGKVASLEQLLTKIDKNWKELLVNPFSFTDEMHSLAMFAEIEKKGLNFVFKMSGNA